MGFAIKNYFSITKKEWNGMLILAVLTILVLLAPDLYQLFVTPEKVDFTRIKEAQVIIDAASTERDHYKTYYHSNSNASFTREKSKPVYFSFNPNNLPVSAWEKLGLSERQIKVIKNYETKGGKFYKKEDLQKIYSITPEDYARLEPYIDIPERSFSNTYSNSPRTSNSTKTFNAKPLAIVDINHADSAELTTIRGIGPAFATRILKYRNRLGGFYRKNQLLEVYGLDSAKYEEIEKQVIVNGNQITKINLNTCTFDDLKRNPYLSFKQMNAIIQYRKQHGNFKSITDLKNIAILTDEVVSKIEPYFSY